MNTTKFLLGLCLALACSELVRADESEPKFAIRAYAVEGNSVLTADEINGVLRPFTGEALDFETIQSAIGALQAYYDAAGYGAVKALLPEQDIEDGKVRLRIVEARVGRI